jgi:hypothetical protein
MTLEEFISNVNKSIYLREFSFSKNQFTPLKSSELEFSDHVIWLDDLLITFQLKERELSSFESIEKEINWFKKKVLGKATKQIRDTLSYLETYSEIEIVNERGHSFNVISGNIKKKIHIVLYSPHEHLPIEYKWKKFYLSSTAGFIHLITAENYEGVCQTLITPAEIGEYFEFRKEICNKYEEIGNSLPEQSLIGQFLSGEMDSEPHWDFDKYLIDLTQEFEDFDITHILHNFLEKTVENSNEAYDYYRILSELAKLKRTELKEVKKRISWSLENCKKNEITLPFRVVFPRTGCGFVFCVVPNEWLHRTVPALKNYTYAHKYDQKLSKCIGISVGRDGEYIDIGWCLIDEKWTYDEVMKRRLLENFPFRKVEEIHSKTYHFESNK